MSACQRQFALLALIVGFFGSGLAQAQDSTLIDFEIKDQFDKVHEDEDFHGKVLCVIGSNKGGSEFNPLWARAISDSLAARPGMEEVRILRVADLRGVPFFLKGTTKGKFPKEPEEWVLMDWKGAFAKAYDYVPDTSNILVFDRNGILIHREHGNNPEDGTIPDIIILLQEAM